MSDVVKSLSIANLVNQRGGVVDRIRQAVSLLAEAQEMAKAAQIGFPRLVVDNSYSTRSTAPLTGDYSKRGEAEAAMIRIVDAEAWKFLMNESGLRSFMDAKAREEWSKQIHEGEVPELTAETVEATFAQLYAARGDMFERGVLEHFRRLSWDYKTNQPFKFGKRIILSYFASNGYPDHGSANRLDDLVRVFHVVDGKPEPDHRQGVYHLAYAAIKEGRTELENDYIHLKWFKKGSAHVTFKRLDLVAQLNAILTKHHPNALASEVCH